MKMDFNSGLNKLFILLFLVQLMSLAACGNKKPAKKVVTKEMLMDHNRKLLGLETEIIKKYIADKELEMQHTETGLWYRFVADSVGKNAVKDQVVHLNYKISLLNGEVCYSSDNDGVWSLVVGKGDNESGIQEALLMLSVGDSIEMILPPHLAHGLAGDGGRIPPQSILKYDLKVISIEN